jgi:tetratricopeptide (TPR) repeat protein
MIKTIAVALTGAFFGILLYKTFPKYWKWTLTRAPLIRKYWLFVVPFFLASVAIYVCIYKFSSSNQLENNISTAGHFIMLSFTIYLGYLAFLQVIEGRIDNLKQNASLQFRSGRNERAIKTYEEIFNIKPDDFSALAELLELYLIEKRFFPFEQKINILKKSAIGDREHKIVAYLETAKLLFQYGGESAREKISEAVTTFSKKLGDISWGFKEVKNSDVYKNSNQDTKRVFENFTNYLNGSLDKELLEEFEQGSYDVKPAPKEKVTEASRK